MNSLLQYDTSDLLPLGGRHYQRRPLHSITSVSSGTTCMALDLQAELDVSYSVRVCLPPIKLNIARSPLSRSYSLNRKCARPVSASYQAKGRIRIVGAQHCTTGGKCPIIRGPSPRGGTGSEANFAYRVPKFPSRVYDFFQPNRRLSPHHSGAPEVAFCAILPSTSRATWGWRFS